MPSSIIPACFVLASLLVITAVAEAKPARCFTTDDGYYPCVFRSLDDLGSFEVAADGYPTYSLWMGEPGFAAGFVNLGDRNVALPGLYLRQRDNAACWSNPETDTKICAW